MKNLQPMPVSFFESVKNPAVEYHDEMSFRDFVDVLETFSREQFPGKDAAPLFAATRFDHDRRKKANATTSGLIVLDVDDGTSIEQVSEVLDDLGIECVLYSTASHRADRHKFRVCVPLADPVDYDTHVRAWHAVNQAITSGEADSTKIGMESIFYVPGRYPGAPSVFEVFDGEVFSAEDWIAAVGIDLTELSVENRAGHASRFQERRTGEREGRPPSYGDLDLYETALVSETALNDYLASGEGWHHARFGLMLHMVGRAKKRGIAITADDVVHLFNQVDHVDGGHYQSSKYQRELRNDARKAVQTAGVAA
jgi:hypothetical protein